MIMRRVQHRLRSEEFRSAKIIGRALIDGEHPLAVSSTEPPYEWRMDHFTDRFVRTLDTLDLTGDNENRFSICSELDLTFSKVRIYLQKVRASRRKPRSQR